MNSATLVVPAAIAAAIAIFFIFASPAAIVVEIVNEGTQPDDATFRPDTVSVRPGLTVTWKNADTSAHTVTSGTPGEPASIFDSELMSPGEEYSFTFENRGAFDYYCQLHPNMTGRVVVG